MQISSGPLGDMGPVADDAGSFHPVIVQLDRGSRIQFFHSGISKQEHVEDRTVLERLISKGSINGGIVNSMGIFHGKYRRDIISCRERIMAG